MPTHPDQTRTESTRKSLFQRNTIFGTRVGGRLAVATSVARVLAGLLFILTSFPKFPFAGQAHRDEMAAFVSFGFPDSPTIVLLVGLLELGGGLLLVLGLGTRIAAIALAVNMIGAIATAGVRVGGPFHLGLAPTLLAVMLFLVWSGTGAFGLDRRIADE
ncbi:DoxX family protein [Nocardia seriolae]|nr:DoxX family membrane protein [Nocardia seriolae]APA98695.1 hypothetical protein NS506_04647 [Nocardia seriolae]MTJ63770.1 DoxX family membrane protein [Nocardia seriolae]MTJ74003.1 DoxX family membrane protein [Nocardia seriolae]MTJ88334.1 DoxX family membrane protein [Nocardia seriolae]MTK32319.1 DoxX family membrane protein [Nocardia seriolae]